MIFSPQTIIRLPTHHTKILPMAQNVGIGCSHCVEYQAYGLLGHKAMQCLPPHFLFCKYSRYSLKKEVQVEIQKSKYTNCIFAGYSLHKNKNYNKFT